MAEEDHNIPTIFGNQLQKYAQQLNNALSKFKISDDLEDGNYSSWSRAVYDCFDSLELHHYIDNEEIVDSELDVNFGLKTKKIIVNFILNCLDKNNNTQAINFLIDPEDPRNIVYKPRRLWIFLEKRHYLINAQKLSTISKVLNSINIQRSDSLSI